MLSGWCPNVAARTKGKVSNLMFGTCVLTDQGFLPSFGVQPLSHMKVSMLVDDSGSVLLFIVCVKCSLDVCDVIPKS